MLNNKDIINQTLTKGVIAGLIAYKLDGHFGRWGYTIAPMKFGAGVGIGVALASLLTLPNWADTPEKKGAKFAVSRVAETTGGVIMSLIIDWKDWQYIPPVYIFDNVGKAKFNNINHRLAYVFIADMVAGIITESVASNSLFKV